MKLFPTFTYILYLLFIITSCNPDSHKVVAPEPILDVISYKKTLLVIGDDRSGSTSDIRKLTEEDNIDLFNAVNEKGGGTVAVCLIGNPVAQKREPYMLALRPLEKVHQYDPKNTDLTLTEKSRIKLQNDKIIEANRQALQNNLNSITNFTGNTIKPNIIDYTPAGIDHTDLDDAINRINTLVNEPGYKDYDNIIVVMVSDGRNQPGKGEKPVTGELNHPKAKVYLVGWETATSCFGSSAIEKFSGKDGMINEIKNLK